MISKDSTGRSKTACLSTFLLSFGLAGTLSLPSWAQASPSTDSSDSATSSSSSSSSTSSSTATSSAGANVKLTKEEKKEQKKEKTEEKLLGKTKDSADTSTADDRSAPCTSWIDPVVKPKICLLCIHGLGLYSGSYSNFGKWMAKRGVATYAIDVRGFGSWMKVKGAEDEIDFSACLKDIETTLRSIRAANPGLPVYILGESMGGAISLKAAALYPNLIDGLVSSVPAGSRFKQKKTDLKVALEFLTGPNKQHNMGKAVVTQATANEKLRTDWENDPMDRMDFSAKQLMQFQKFMNENHDAAKLISKSPVLVLQGSEDKLVKPEGTWELFSEISSDDKIYLAVPSEHLIFEEQQDHAQKFDERVSRLVLTWFQTHLPSGAKWNEDASPADHTNTMVKLLNADYAGAKRDLDASIVANAGDPKAFFLRGIAESKLNMPLKAKADFARAMVLGKGNDPAKKANEYLLSMFQDAKPAPSQDAAPDKVILDQAALQAVGAAGQPAILAFYAPWAEQCKDIDKVAAQSTTLARNVKFCKVNIEETAMSALVKACSVGPIPTFVFVSRNGTIGSTSIGMNNFSNFAKQIKIGPAK